MTTTDKAATMERFKALFEPRTIAVVGASPAGIGPGSNFLRNLRTYGFQGDIYPIHPTASEIDGLKAYRSLGGTPKPIDYAYVAVGANRVVEAFSAASGRVRFAQVMSGGFGETKSGRQLQDSLVATARAQDVRLLGPNCMGTHSPRGRLTFLENGDPASGSIGVISQSGGLSIDILRRGFMRGLKFSGLVSLGNSADVDPCDLLEYYLADDQTQVIGLYLEDVADGRRFLDVLRQNRGRKPVVLLKGGTTAQGQRATASHTGAMGTDERIWTGIAQQFGLAMVRTLDEFLSALLTFQCLALNRHRTTRKIVLFGNGGGTSVLAADAFGRCDFEVDPLDAESLAALQELKLPAGSSVDNPIDVPANALRGDKGRIAREIVNTIVSATTKPDALVVHLNVPAILAYKDADVLGDVVDVVLSAASTHRSSMHFAVVLRSDGEASVEKLKRRYIEQLLGSFIPAYSETAECAQALSLLRDNEQYLNDSPPRHSDERAIGTAAASSPGRAQQ